MLRQKEKKQQDVFKDMQKVQNGFGMENKG